jgi:hypothetical protein
MPQSGMRRDVEASHDARREYIRVKIIGKTHMCIDWKKANEHPGPKRAKTSLQTPVLAFAFHLLPPLPIIINEFIIPSVQY